ncbi:catalase [Klebsiella michiganensis]|nr:catalase [Klebsiella michiganensis]
MAVLLNDRPVAKELLTLLKSLKAHGVHAKLLYSEWGKCRPMTVPSCGGRDLCRVAIAYRDAVIVPGGDLQSLSNNGDFHYYLLEAYKHLKPILLAGDARQCKAPLQVASQGEEGIVETDPIDNSSVDALITLMAAHRVWSRSAKIAAIPA